MRRSSMTVLTLAACVASYMLGSHRADSSIVDHMSSGIVAFGWFGTGPNRALDEDGVTWIADEDPVWGWQVDTAIPSLPVPVSEIKFWAWDTFVTFDNHVWRVSSGAWVDAGAWHGGTSATEHVSWGEIKARYR